MTRIGEKRNIDALLLALLRTELANRRTLLAYIKTSLGIGITAIGLLKFTDEQSIYAMLGLLLVPVSFVILAVGIVDYIMTKKKIEDEKKDAEV
ncbi:MAG: DUF202 domain-containing protein [Alphaproteobacteria bacterium]|nr:DUF202 domain-containing protein [Alphaproteobacteria bacterium]HRW30337.1 DUF202 domain-containing protein [Emcibacteraceae bacterium]